MGRRKFVVPAEKREEIVQLAEGLARKLMDEHELHRDDAVDLVGTVLGGSAELVVELAGAPDAVGDAVDVGVQNLVKQAGAVLRPDPKKLLAKAGEAAKKGNVKKAARLIAKAKRVAKRQGIELELEE